MDTTALVTAIIASLAGNIPAMLILYWCTQERKERIEQAERFYRLLLAVAGFETDPDSQKIVKLKADPKPTPEV
jgi:hypothetical protein